MVKIKAIDKGILLKDNILELDLSKIKNTVTLMKKWNNIFESINVKNLDINSILKNDTELLHNLDFENLLLTLKKHLKTNNIDLHLRKENFIEETK